MQLKPSQLHEALKQGLKPAYLLLGEEPWQLTLLADQVRTAARERGFSERRLHVVMPGFDWREVAFEEESRGLFARRRLLDIVVPEGKIDRSGGRILERFAERPPGDTLLLLVLESPTVPNGSWFRALEKIGVAVRVERVTGQTFLRWLKKRAARLGLDLSEGAAELLADRTEGHLLAADQVLQLLKLLHGEAPIDREAVQRVVEENCRLSLFDWLDTLLVGDAGRALHHLKALRQEGTPVALLLWGVVQELRQLIQLKTAKRQGVALEALFGKLRIRQKRRHRYQLALERFALRDLERLLCGCLEVDRQIKGVAPGDPWLTLERLTLKIVGVAGSGGGNETLES